LFKKLVAILGMCSLFGCASMGTDEGQTAVARIGVQYATLKVINGDIDRAEAVLDVVNAAIALAEGGDLVPIDLLESQIRAVIPWDGLDDADKQLVNLLILQVRAELEVRVDDGLIDAEKVAQVLEVLKWVRDAAQTATIPVE
jgi:hypothetical protein